MKWVFNDGGKSDAGIKAKGDCVVRAVAIATGQRYLDVFSVLSLGQSSQRVTKCGKTYRNAANGVSTGRKWFKDYMNALGWEWVATMGIGSGCKVHLRDGELPMGRLIVRVSRHCVAVIDGVIHDNHDCSRRGTRCVYGYWKKGENEQGNV